MRRILIVVPLATLVLVTSTGGTLAAPSEWPDSSPGPPSTSSTSIVVAADLLADGDVPPNFDPKQGISESGTGITAQKAAVATGEQVEDLDARTERSQTFANPDGRFTSRLSAGPVRMQRDGEWVDFDTSLTEVGGRLVPEAVPADVSFSADGSGEFASLNSGARGLGLRWPTALKDPVVAGDTATYRDAVPGGDLVVQATLDGFRQWVVLRERPTGPLTLTLPVDLQGSVLTEDAAGELVLTTPQGTMIAEAPTPTMWGDAIDPQTDEPTRSAPVPTAIRKTVDGVDLVLSPPAAFLLDPSVQYPVKIDPSFAERGVSDTFVDTGYGSSQGSSTELRTGSYGSGKSRALMQFNIDEVAGHVDAARLTVTNYHSWSCAARETQVRRVLEPWSWSSAIWANQPAYTATLYGARSFAHGSSGCAAAPVDFDIRRLVEIWAEGSSPNHGLLLHAADENDTMSWRKYRSANYVDGASSTEPHVDVTWHETDAPTTPVITSPSHPSQSSWYASQAVDARWISQDTSTVQYARVVDQNPTTAVGSEGTYSSDPNLTATYGTGTWYVHVRARDQWGTYSATTAHYKIQIDALAPTTPSGITSTTHTVGTASSNTNITFTWTASSEAHSGGLRYLWALTSSSAQSGATTSGFTSTTGRNATSPPTANGPYYIHVKAIDAAGNMSADAIAGPFTSRPEPAFSPRASRLDGGLIVRWGAAPTHGADVTGYRITVLPRGASYTTSATARELTVTGLTNGTTHDLLIATLGVTGAGGEVSIPGVTPAPDQAPPSTTAVPAPALTGPSGGVTEARSGIR